MRKLLFPILMIVAGTSILLAHDPSKRSHHYRWGHGFSINTTNADSDDCQDHLRILHDDGDTAYGEESRTLPNAPLKVTAARNGGIHVRQWERAEIGLKVCKAAAGDSDQEAKGRVDAIKLNITGNEVSIDDSQAREGTGRRNGWAALVLLNVPKGATLDLSAHNGGISVKKLSANVMARTVNGGISLVESSGKLDVEAQNGGISVKDCSGEVNVDVQNGGVNLQLAETWQGKGLSASTRNGGLHVAVPANFKSSLEVESRGHGRMRCRGAICNTAERGWDDERPKYLRIGTNPIVKASTVNGGVVIVERGTDSAEDDD